MADLRHGGDIIAHTVYPTRLEQAYGDDHVYLARSGVDGQARLGHFCLC